MEIQAYVDIQCTRSKNEALLCEFLQNLWLVYPKFARKQIQYNAMLNVVPNVVSAPCTSCTKVLRYQWVLHWKLHLWIVTSRIKLVPNAYLSIFSVLPLMFTVIINNVDINTNHLFKNYFLVI